MKNIALLSLFVVLFLTSCNKYSEGPNFSLLTRKARVTNDWVLESYTKDGTELYDASYEMNLSIESDGTYSRSIITPNLGQLQSETTHGTWEFDNSQSSIILMENGINSFCFKNKERLTKCQGIIKKMFCLEKSPNFRHELV